MWKNISMKYFSIKIFILFSAVLLADLISAYLIRLPVSSMFLRNLPIHFLMGLLFVIPRSFIKKQSNVLIMQLILLTIFIFSISIYLKNVFSHSLMFSLTYSLSFIGLCIGVTVVKELNKMNKLISVLCIAIIIDFFAKWGLRNFAIDQREILVVVSEVIIFLGVALGSLTGEYIVSSKTT